MLIKNWGSKSFNAGINDDLFSDKSYKNLQSWCIALIGRMDGYNTYCNIHQAPLVSKYIKRMQINATEE